MPRYLYKQFVFGRRELNYQVYMTFKISRNVLVYEQQKALIASLSVNILRLMINVASTVDHTSDGEQVCGRGIFQLCARHLIG